MSVFWCISSWRELRQGIRYPGRERCFGVWFLGDFLMIEYNQAGGIQSLRSTHDECGRDEKMPLEHTGKDSVVSVEEEKICLPILVTC